MPDPALKLQPGPLLPLTLSDLTLFTICASKLPSGSPMPAQINLLKRTEGDVVEIINPGGLHSPCTNTKLIIPIFALDPDEDVITFSTKWNFGDGPTIKVGPDEARFLESAGKPVELTITASDGKLTDSQTITFKVHYEQPPTP